jgi:methylmalonyl-CoA/ethylmalonyl-CoA epimerase
MNDPIGAQPVMFKKVNHIALITEDFERSIETFKGLGFECTQVIEAKEHNLRVAFLPVGDTALEVIYHSSPPDASDAMANLVASQKGSINHVCIEVDDLEAAIDKFEKNGARLVEGCPRPGAHGRVAFFYPETTAGLLIELSGV